MPDFRMKRREALAGGFASILAQVPDVKTKSDGDADEADRVGQDDDKVDEEEDHPRFRTMFLSWLEVASERLALPILPDTTSSPSETTLHVRGVHPAICLSLQGSSGFNMSVMWAGVFWDSLLWLDVHERPTPEGSGWVNGLAIEEYQFVHPTLEALLRADIIEPLLNWINQDLVRATHLALWGSDTDATWARLVRDGEVLNTSWTIEKNGGVPSYLLPVHSLGL